MLCYASSGLAYGSRLAYGKFCLVQTLPVLLVPDSTGSFWTIWAVARHPLSGDACSCKKFCLGKCVDWSKIEKSAYLQAMTASVADGSRIKQLLRNALTDDISSREMFMKGIDHSYYYEQEDEV